MTRFRKVILWAGLFAFIPGARLLSADSGDGAADLREVQELIRTHVPGVTEAELNRTAIQGMVAALGTKAELITKDEPKASARTEPLISRSETLEENMGYVRVVRVDQGLGAELKNIFERMDSTNRLKGLVLDLRYAHGTNYQSAADVADLFLSKPAPLLNWGRGMVSSSEKANSIRLPLAILVNSGTSQAAEALAGVLRANGAGLILGSKTAGEAFVTQDFPLKNGQRLRLATGTVTLGDGSALPASGIKPDIDVTVSLEDERAYYADSFLVLPRSNLVADASMIATNGQGGTNGSRRVRFNEAELVRQRAEGLNREGTQPTQERPVEADVPVVSDPALARALDLLKGLAVVRQSRS